jgi:hypothetical protein
MQDVPYYYGGWNLTDEANKHNKPRRFNYSGTLSWFIDSNTILNLRAVGFILNGQVQILKKLIQTDLILSTPIPAMYGGIQVQKSIPGTQS